MSLITHFIRDELGATAIEYGLIAALTTIVAITGITAFTTGFGNLMGEVSSQFTNATGSN